MVISSLRYVSIGTEILILMNDDRKKGAGPKTMQDYYHIVNGTGTRLHNKNPQTFV